MRIAKMVKNKTIGFFAAGAIYCIYGLNIVMSKDLLKCCVMSPTMILFVRMTGAALLFWISSLLFVREKVEKSDLGRIFLASLLGMSVPQMASIWGLTMSTPLDASMINSLKPLFAIIASFILFREHQTARTWAGIIMALAGVSALILSGGNMDTAFKTTPLGLLVLSMNGLSFAFYLALFKPLVKKYHPVTFMKWTLLFTVLVLFPFVFNDITAVHMELMTPLRYREFAFLVVAATFICYFLSPIAQKNISPTEYCILAYLQPLTATAYSLARGFDVLTVPKVVAMVFMFAGVWIANSSKLSLYEKNSAHK